MACSLDILPMLASVYFWMIYCLFINTHWLVKSIKQMLYRSENKSVCQIGYAWGKHEGWIFVWFDFWFLK